MSDEDDYDKGLAFISKGSIFRWAKMFCVKRNLCKNVFVTQQKKGRQNQS